MKHLKYDIKDLFGVIKVFPKSNSFERIRFLDDKSSNYSWCNAVGYNIFDFEEIFMTAFIEKPEELKKMKSKLHDPLNCPHIKLSSTGPWPCPNCDKTKMPPEPEIYW